MQVKWYHTVIVSIIILLGINFVSLFPAPYWVSQKGIHGEVIYYIFISLSVFTPIIIHYIKMFDQKDK